MQLSLTYLNKLDIYLEYNMPTNFPGSLDTFTTLDHSLSDAVVALETRARQNTDNLLYDTLTHNLWLAGTTFNDVTDDSYTATLWNALWNTNAPDISGQAGGASDPFVKYFRCTHDANSQAGIVQFLEAEDTVPLRGKTLSLSADLWGTGVTSLRMAVLEWTSTADVVTSDVVGTWGTGNPTLAANWAYIGTPAAITITTTRTRYAVNNLIVGSSTNNLAVFIWTDAVEVNTDLWNVARVKLEVSNAATDFVPRPFTLEKYLINRFYAKTFAPDVAPAQSSASTTGAVYGRGVVTTIGTIWGTWRPIPELRTTPSVTTYSPFTADANWRSGANTASITVLVASATAGMIAIGSQTDAPTVNTNYFIHLTADARL